MKTEAEFLDHFRGLPNNILQTACTYVSQGVDYRGCSKPLMANEYAGKGTKIARGLSGATLLQINAEVVRIYAIGGVSRAQSLSVFGWLRKRELITEEQRRGR